VTGRSLAPGPAHGLPGQFRPDRRGDGLPEIRVERPDEIAPAIGKALAADRPTVVDVFTDVNCPALEPWTP